ncbi:thaumatin-like protein isoform X3 [Amborella trichopoda]|uniref:thaumatin-like protein isoform X3 n=1 Tax=Amborella trichopoda TaxID=13333 RepID=UPI0009C071AF|nr:thaumatin-like protein isoform X3 [Amborella trichopoda]|eukprot:XP_020524436.1 thaumatin-like protein isoform X3 [Amborella trichopoda]
MWWSCRIKMFPWARPSLFVGVLGLAPSPIEARTFTIVNDCKETVWPGITPGEALAGGGFALKPGQSRILTAPTGWSGRIWGRTGCSFDDTGNGSCQTGGCGSSLKCGGSGNTPATLAEFTLGARDFYDVSLVDGFNLPMVVTPVHGQGNCSSAGCDGDLRDTCPSELAVKAGSQTVGCRSACNVFGSEQYCCTGMHANSLTCQPTSYSKKFKEACPAAYSYAYDDPTSIFICVDADYIVTFCSKSGKQQPTTANMWGSQGTQGVHLLQQQAHMHRRFPIA